MTTVFVALVVVASGCSYTTVTLAPTVPPNAQASVVLADNGTLLTTLHAGENRTEITLDQVPQHVQDAIVAIEDRRFWNHAGIDLPAILRAMRRNIDEGEVVEGGSTITQQFVKNALLASDRTLDRKIEEATLSIQVEREYSKEEILEYYLNTVYFGAGAYGIEAAAKVYFGKPAEELDVPEGALLAGLVKAPSTNDPFVNGEGALRRRRLVLDAMVEEGYLTAEEGETFAAGDVELAAPDPETDYPAAYFVQEVKRFMLTHPAFGRTREERTRRLFTGGLTIETSLDLQLQSHAEHAAHLVLSDPANDPDTAIVSMDPSNGHVLAMVGGRDFFDGGPRSKFNLATQGRRPAGSSFKPLVLAAAIEEGIPVSQVYSAPSTIEIPVTNDTWEVENYGGSPGGWVDLTEATVRSYNTAYAQLVMDVGPADAVAMAAHLGVSSPLLAVPSAVLGANDVSALDMTAAYSTFANRGIRNDIHHELGVGGVVGPHCRLGEIHPSARRSSVVLDLPGVVGDGYLDRRWCRVHLAHRDALFDGSGEDQWFERRACRTPALCGEVELRPRSSVEEVAAADHRQHVAIGWVHRHDGCVRIVRGIRQHQVGSMLGMRLQLEVEAGLDREPTGEQAPRALLASSAECGVRQHEPLHFLHEVSGRIVGLRVRGREFDVASGKCFAFLRGQVTLLDHCVEHESATSQCPFPVHERVVCRRGLHQPGEQCTFWDVEFLCRLAEVHLGGSLDAISTGPEIDGVEVVLKDFLLRVLAFDLNRQRRLFDLPVECAVRGEECVFHELLCDGRTALDHLAFIDVTSHGPENGWQVDAGVIPETAVFDGYDGVLNVLWDLVERDLCPVLTCMESREQCAVVGEHHRCLCVRWDRRRQCHGRVRTAGGDDDESDEDRRH